MNIVIIGAGAFGTALGQILVENGHSVKYYDPFLLKNSLQDTLQDAELVVLAVPSAAVDETLPKLPKDVPLVVTTKGILNYEIFKNFKDVMVLSGPGFADDIKAHKHTFLTISDKRLDKLFGTDYITFDYSDDPKGMLLCGALKNVYAILAGLSGFEPDSFEYNDYLTHATREMYDLLKANGADPETVWLACGKSDLILTCSPPSRNFEFGQKIRKNPNSRPEKTVEGFTILKKIRAGELIVPDSAKLLKGLVERSAKWD
ncbi:hypothetical protein IKX73_01065 [Candidatus Saccharibacteria bacterium]|nr:hypothetical protein [Candidatus Saccharibacteria bacterium]